MLEIDDLSKRYGAVRALDGASFTARRGPPRRLPRPERRGQDDDDALHLRAGHAGLAATVRWDGAPIDAATRLRFGYMPEQRGLYPRMRVGEQLAYFGQHHGLSRSVARTKAGEWLERFGLGDRAKSKLEDLSHGNQQRVQLATALVHDPELLVLDEPFSGLDPIGIATMAGVLRERAGAGVGVVFSSHQLDLVEEVCEDVVIISRGRVVAEGGDRGAQGPARAGATSTSRSRAAAAPGSARPTTTPSSSATATACGCSSTRRSTSTGCWPPRGPRARSAASATSRPSCRSCSWRRSTRPSRSRPDGQLLEALT